VDRLTCGRCGVSESSMSSASSARFAAILCRRWSKSKPSIRTNESLGVARYLEFLPLSKFDRSLSLAKAALPAAVDPAGGEIRPSPLFAKNEAMNPTGSFKDAVRSSRSTRPKHGIQDGRDDFHGNMAGSTAATPPRPDSGASSSSRKTPPKKKFWRPRLWRPDRQSPGEYAAPLPEELRDRKIPDIYFMNSVDPYRIEGYKVTGSNFHQGGPGHPTMFSSRHAGGHLIA